MKIMVSDHIHLQFLRAMRRVADEKFCVTLRSEGESLNYSVSYPMIADQNKNEVVPSAASHLNV